MESIDLIKALREALKEAFGVIVPDKVMAYIIIFIAGIALLIVAISICVKIYKWVSVAWNNPWRKKKIKEILSPDYLDQLKEQEYFISTKFTTSPPHNLDDPMEVERTESAKNLIDHFVDKVLVEDNTTNRFFCILAGAGMGKTTWTVNLVTSYINRYKENTYPYEIVLISLAHKDFADKVNQVNLKGNTILILDALDENADASNNLDSFMRNLEHIIQDFRFVILTSRTQFFPSEEAEPYKTGILKLSGEKGNFVFHKMYISPFSQEDVAAFLKKKYKKRKRRKKAESIVKRCASLATRPLLLSHLDDILDSDRDYLSLYDIYTALIEAWVKREVLFIKGVEDDELRKKLYDFSLNFALELFKNREQSTNMRMIKSNYEEFISTHNYTDYNFSGRSLINRDAEGTLKFSHKTFYEYFLANAKIYNPDLDLPDSGYELAWTFYEQIVRRKLKNVLSMGVALVDDDVMLCHRRLGSVDFDYRWLSKIVPIRRVGVVPSILVNNTNNFTTWLQTSDVETIDILGYENENLKKLLCIPNLKEVNILRTSRLSSKGRQQMQKLEDNGIAIIESKWYPSPYNSRPVYYMRRMEDDSSSVRTIMESYLSFLRTQNSTKSIEYFVKSNSIVNIKIEEITKG